jgi:hypothetical protein
MGIFGGESSGTGSMGQGFNANQGTSAGAGSLSGGSKPAGGGNSAGSGPTGGSGLFGLFGPGVASQGQSGGNAYSGLLSRTDAGFYGHMTIEKCKSMSGSKSTLVSDKSSFAKNNWNGLHTGGKKGK